MNTKRKIIVIDEEKCDGCELCIPSCPEGAMQIVDTPKGPKARLVKESFCDGLGACIGDCPQDALTIEERSVENYDENAVVSFLKDKSPELLEKHLTHLKEHALEMHQHTAHKGSVSCPSAQMQQWDKDSESVKLSVKLPSELRQWPIQLHLVSPHAPYFKNADLVLVADCVPFAYANFHQDFLEEKTIAIACPKLDDVEPYVDKIKEIIESSEIKSLKVMHMEVPCCFGLVQIAKEALGQSKKDIPFETVVVSIKGVVN